jgi:hypothetical protein
MLELGGNNKERLDAEKDKKDEGGKKAPMVPAVFGKKIDTVKETNITKAVSTARKLATQFWLSVFIKEKKEFGTQTSAPNEIIVRLELELKSSGVLLE